jgi:hypothetical protein
MEIVALYPQRRQLSSEARPSLDILVDRFTAEEQWRDAAPGQWYRSAALALVYRCRGGSEGARYSSTE